MLIAIGSIKHIFACPKSLNGRIEQVVAKTDTDTLPLAAKHREHAAGITFDVDFGKLFCSLSQFIKKFYLQRCTKGT